MRGRGTIHPAQHATFFIYCAGSSHVKIGASDEVPTSIRIRPYSAPSSFQPSLGRGGPSGTPSNDATQRPVPACSTIRIRYVRGISVYDGPPESPFETSSSFLFMGAFQPARAHLHSQVFLPLSTTGRATKEHSYLWLSFVMTSSSRAFAPGIVFYEISYRGLQDKVIRMGQGRRSQRLVMCSPPCFFDASHAFRDPGP